MKCYFADLTFEKSRNGKPLYRCLNDGCNIATYNPSSSSICRCGQPAAPRAPEPQPPCIHRGPIIALITKCGCGAIGPAPVSTCSLFAFCVPHNLNIKAKWRDVVSSKPAACSTCNKRADC